MITVHKSTIPKTLLARPGTFASESRILPRTCTPGVLEFCCTSDADIAALNKTGNLDMEIYHGKV